MYSILIKLQVDVEAPAKLYASIGIFPSFSHDFLCLYRDSPGLYGDSPGFYGDSPAIG
jgi:hypothetical protein